MKSALQAIGFIAAITVALIGASLLIDLISTVGTLETRIAALEAQPRTSADQTTHQRTRRAQQAAAQFTVKRTADNPSGHSSAGPATARSADASAVATAAAGTATTVAVDATAPETPLIATFVERGYMYAREWETLSAELGELPVEQNRAFWLEMNQALADGRIEIFDE